MEVPLFPTVNLVTNGRPKGVVMGVRDERVALMSVDDGDPVTLKVTGSGESLGVPVPNSFARRTIV